MSKVHMDNDQLCIVILHVHRLNGSAQTGTVVQYKGNPY